MKFKKITVIIPVFLILLGACDQPMEHYMMVFLEKNGVMIEKVGIEPFPPSEIVQNIQLEYPIPLEYSLDRDDYNMLIKHNYAQYSSFPDFQITVQSKSSGEYYFINTDRSDPDCFMVHDRMVIFNKDPKHEMRLIWHSGGAGRDPRCEQIVEKGEIIRIPINFYDSNENFVGREILFAKHVKNGTHKYK